MSSQTLATKAAACSRKQVKQHSLCCVPLPTTSAAELTLEKWCTQRRGRVLLKVASQAHQGRRRWLAGVEVEAVEIGRPPLVPLLSSSGAHCLPCCRVCTGAVLRSIEQKLGAFRGLAWAQHFHFCTISDETASVKAHHVDM